MTDLQQALGPIEAVAPLAEMQAACMSRAAQGLREIQSWAAAYAVMLECGNCTVKDLMNADRGLWSATSRAGEALQTFGASLSCEGIA